MNSFKEFKKVMNSFKDLQKHLKQKDINYYSCIQFKEKKSHFA